MRDSIALPFRQQTPEWEDARRDGIGSSDAAIIAGERGSVFELWAIKTRQIDPPALDPDTAAMFDLGHKLEPVIAAVYSEREGRPLRRVNQMLARRDEPWAFASLDRVSAVKGERRIVELKTAPWRPWGIGEPVPGDIQAQVQHQLWVTGYEIADVVVLHRGYDLKVHEIPRDPAFIDNLIFLEREFRGWVETGTQPPVDGADATRLALQRMFPRDDGEILEATPELSQLALDLQAAQAAAKAAADTEASIKNALRAILGEALGVEGLGWKITWKRGKDTTATNWQAVAQAYRTLLEQVDDEGAIPTFSSPPTDDPADSRPLTLAELVDSIQSIHTATTPGSRSLRPWFAQGAET